MGYTVEGWSSSGRGGLGGVCVSPFVCVRMGPGACAWGPAEVRAGGRAGGGGATAALWSGCETSQRLSSSYSGWQWTRPSKLTFQERRAQTVAADRQPDGSDARRIVCVARGTSSTWMDGLANRARIVSRNETGTRRPAALGRSTTQCIVHADGSWRRRTVYDNVLAILSHLATLTGPFSPHGTLRSLPERVI